MHLRTHFNSNCKNINITAELTQLKQEGIATHELVKYLITLTNDKTPMAIAIIYKKNIEGEYFTAYIENALCLKPILKAP